MIPVLIALAAAAAAAAADPVPAPALAAAADPAVKSAAETPAKPGTPLWDDAKVGMTPDQVHVTFPAARPVKDGESLLDTAKQLFILPGVRLPTGLHSTMSFFFRDDSLNEVKLVADVPSGQTAANVRRAEDLSKALKRTFGEPVSCGRRESLLAFECDWISRGLSVSVTYMDVAGLSPMLETTVRGIVSAEASGPPPQGVRPNKGAPAARLGRAAPPG